MAFFSKKKSEPATHPITDFWNWWSAEGYTLSPHQESSATEELTRRVSAIHPDLAWHFGPGADAEHRLTVSAGGIGEVRPAAERWLRAARALETAPADAVDAMTVREAVATIAASADPDQWAGVEWEEEDGAPGLAADDDALDALHAMEDSLTATMGERAVLVGHESSRGSRVFHVYTDGEDGNAADQLQQWARSQGVQESSALDPAWRNVRHLTG